jgi:hypothetical protein
MVRIICLVLTCAALQATAARAQTDHAWSRGTELGAVIDGAVDGAATGPALGGSAGWEVSPRLTFEGRGVWYWRGTGAEGFGADIGMLVNLAPKPRATPFLAAGFGLYAATFDSPDATMSDYYRNRYGPGSPTTAGRRTFTDPALRMGGGVDLHFRRHLALRPEVSVLLIWNNGRATTLTTFGTVIAYRFEDHPVTPRR